MYMGDNCYFFFHPPGEGGLLDSPIISTLGYTLDRSIAGVAVLVLVLVLDDFS